MAVKIEPLAFLLCLMLLFPGAIYGQEAETKGIVSDIIGTFESKASGGYEAYQNTDSGVVSYGKYQFTAIYGTEGSLYAVLKRYTELSQSSTSKKIYENYVKNTNPWSDLKTLRRDKNLADLLKEASREGAMIDAQEYVFTTTFYDPIKQRAAKNSVTSALGITILCDTRVNGHYLTAIEQTEDYFKGKQYTEREWLKYFLDRRKDLLAKGDPNLNRVSILRKLVDDETVDLTQGNSDHKFVLGMYGEVDAVDAIPSIEQAENGEDKARPLSESTPVVADVAQLGMIGKEQQQTEQATTFNAPPVFENTKITIGSEYRDGWQWEKGSEEWKIQEKNRAEEAAAEWQRKTGSDPIKSKEWYNEGIDLLNQGNYAEAMRAFMTAISYDMSNEAAWEIYWDIYMSNKTAWENWARTYTQPAQIPVSNSQGTKEEELRKAQTPVPNSQEPNEDELREKLRYINSWFAAGAPGLS